MQFFSRLLKNTLMYFPQNVREPIEEYRDLTYHNIIVWRGKIWGDLTYKNDPLSPFTDQTAKDGKAKKAYDKMKAKLSEYASEQE